MNSETENIIQSEPNKVRQPRDYSFIRNNHYGNIIIKATPRLNKVDQPEKARYFKTFYYCGKQLGVNQGIVKYSCDGTNKCYGGKSKIDKTLWNFKYVNDIPVEQIEIKPKKVKPIKVKSKETTNESS